MSNHQSLRDVFVVHNPALFKSGFSSDLAVGQLGIFEADPNKDRTAIAAPAYPANKAIMFVQGTREVPVNLLGAIANASKPSKTIKAKKILGFTGRKAERGQDQVVTIGYDGVDITKTISAKCEETKMVWLKLSGGPIDQIFHTEGKGYVRQFSLFSGCCDDCGDNCADVAAEAIAQDLADQINNDPILSLGTRTGNKLIRASVISNSTPPTPDGDCVQWTLCVCDDGSPAALGNVQSQYPGSVITLLSRTGSISCYEVILPFQATLADFTNAGVVSIADCDSCPDGFTAVGPMFAYKVVVVDNGTDVNMGTVATALGLSGAGETINRVSYGNGKSTYVVQSLSELTDPGENEIQRLSGAESGTAGDFTLTFNGQVTGNIAWDATAAEVQIALEALSNIQPGDVSVTGGPINSATPMDVEFMGQYANQNLAIMIVTDNITDDTVVVAEQNAGVPGYDLELLSGADRTVCINTTASTVAWVEGDALVYFDRAFIITLKDDVCGNSRLTELQAAYPSLSISELGESPDCVRQYSTTVSSDCVPEGCDPGVPKWVTPEPYQGIKWVAEPLTAGDGTSFGVQLQSTYVDLMVNDCAFEHWRYDAEPLFIEVSQHSSDYNDKPTICADEWPITEIQGTKLPIGVGSRVREEEAFFKGYERKYRDSNPIVRMYQDSELQTDPQKFYDQYTLAFEFDYHQSWFSEKNTDSYRLEFYFPEGTGKQFEAAMNSYLTSVGIDIEPVVL